MPRQTIYKTPNQREPKPVHDVHSDRVRDSQTSSMVAKFCRELPGPGGLHVLCHMLQPIGKYGCPCPEPASARHQTMIGETGLPGSLDQLSGWLLQRLLRRGDYQTHRLQPDSGMHSDGERVLIERIRSATVMAEAYPAFAKHNPAFEQCALGVWEGEGGTIVERPKRTLASRGLR